MNKNNIILITIVPIALIVILSTGSFATTLTVETTNQQSITGEVVDITGGYTYSSSSFLYASDTIAADGDEWGASVITDDITSGNWYYAITLSAVTANTPTAGDVSVQLSTDDGVTYTTLGTVSFTAPVGGITGDSTFWFDTGIDSDGIAEGALTLVITVSPA